VKRPSPKIETYNINWNTHTVLNWTPQRQLFCSQSETTHHLRSINANANTWMLYKY